MPEFKRSRKSAQYLQEKRFSLDLDCHLLAGVELCGHGNWKVIVTTFPFKDKTPTNLKDRFRNMCRKGFVQFDKKTNLLEILSDRLLEKFEKFKLESSIYKQRVASYEKFLSNRSDGEFVPTSEYFRLFKDRFTDEMDYQLVAGLNIIGIGAWKGIFKLFKFDSLKDPSALSGRYKALLQLNVLKEWNDVSGGVHLEILDPEFKIGYEKFFKNSDICDKALVKMMTDEEVILKGSVQKTHLSYEEFKQMNIPEISEVLEEQVKTPKLSLKPKSKVVKLKFTSSSSNKKIVKKKIKKEKHKKLEIKNTTLQANTNVSIKDTKRDPLKEIVLGQPSIKESKTSGKRQLYYKKHNISSGMKWNQNDIEKLLEGVRKYGSSAWGKIQKEFFPDRTAPAISRRYRRVIYRK